MRNTTGHPHPGAFGGQFPRGNMKNAVQHSTNNISNNQSEHSQTASTSKEGSRAFLTKRHAFFENKVQTGDRDIEQRCT